MSRWVLLEQTLQSGPHLRFKQQDTPIEGETAYVRDAWPEMFQEGIHESLFVAKTCEERDADVACLARFAPALNRKAADDRALSSLVVRRKPEHWPPRRTGCSPAFPVPPAPMKRVLLIYQS
jgi:hypothetical protein